jgi:N,N'-diacetylchitobiose phosphorylase
VAYLLALVCAFAVKAAYGLRIRRNFFTESIMSTHDYTDPNAAPAVLHRLSNGRYEVLISDTGGGVSSCDGLALTRWRADPVEDDLGTFVYLRDLDDGRFWSLGYQPTRTPAGTYRSEAAGGSFALAREDDGIAARLQVNVAAEADIELRRIELTNASSRPRRIELTSYLEVVLFPAAADDAHSAFAKLFVQTEWDSAHAALLARRRPRAAHERWPWLVHALVGATVREWETDRMRFLGRGRTPACPAALLGNEPLSGSTGNVLDPVMSLRTVVELAPGTGAELLFLTGAARGRDAALQLLQPYVAAARVQPVRAAADSGTPATSPGPEQAPATADEGADGLVFFNGYGGFTVEGDEYVVHLPWQGGALRRPPLPWINVVSNECCGFLVSESGAGYAWARNSQANRLTPWFNDPVSDPHGEACYLRDEASGVSWSPLPGPRPPGCDYEARHGFGYSRFSCRHDDLDQESTLFVPRRDPVRILRLRLTHHGTEPRRLSLFSYQRLVLGALPASPSPVVTAFDATLEVLRAINREAGDFAGGIVFACAVVSGTRVEESAYTCDRGAFIGRHGDPSHPAGLRPGARLDGACGGDLEPCFAQQLIITLAPGETAECAFLLGECRDEADLERLVAHYRTPGAVQAAFEEVREYWAGLVASVHVETPSPAIDVLLNGWLLYQTLACRIQARSAFYQSGGAYGFRDQLQDAAALVGVRPDLTRAQLLLHAAHQFAEGDVLHWWHPAPVERGLRTRFSDDLLWLPYLTSHYIDVTGDAAVLDEPAPFLSARLLERGEDEAYLKPDISNASADLYEHCCLALDRSLTRGAHGLPLMGTGDWNDGMNRVGREGRGESVWLGFFLYRILGDFLPLCEGRNDRSRISRYYDYRARLGEALQASGWDGAWYRRAYYDDGTPLGCAGDPECRIDALAQAWAVLSAAAPRTRAEQAMDALERELISEVDGIVRLLTPPFVDSPHDPGYIKGYVAGVRENGGQYTHAACWVVMALAALGRNERAARVLEMLSPVRHAATPEGVALYRLEPYVVAADVYGEPPHTGRGGWSWYTGSAGWLYRAALESVLGVRVTQGRTLLIHPCIPADWPGFRLRYRLPDGATQCEIAVENPHGGRQVSAARLDGRDLPVSDGVARITLPEAGGDYRIEVRLG